MDKKQTGVIKQTGQTRKRISTGELQEMMLEKRTFLCVGLDTDIEQLPAGVERSIESIVSFNKAIMEATFPFAVAFKINTAFYEAHGAAGWQAMADTVAAAPEGAYLIADAKRGDIGNTAAQYAKAFFDTLPFDALTVSPYMGVDTLLPYMAYPEAELFVLACTSNPGYADFEMRQLADGGYLFEEVVRKCGQIEPAEIRSRIHFVAGATHIEQLKAVRRLAPHTILLVPGVGAQGGSLEDVAHAAMNNTCGLLVNASRSIIYAGNDNATHEGGMQDFGHKAAKAAELIQLDMAKLMLERGI
jgi:orotidine-5'-phosphate decarboxylase